MAPRVVLYSMPISHWCVSADRMLAFKRVPFRTEYVPYHDKRRLIAATGQDYVPSIMWNGKFVPWHDIPEFLEEKVPEPTLHPDGMGAVADVLAHWGHMVLEEKVWRAVVTQVPPVLRDDLERWVFEEMQTRARGPWHVLQGRRREFEKDMVEHFELVDDMLDGKKWVLGSPSVADFGIYGGLSPLLTVGRSPPARLRALGAWIARIKALRPTARATGRPSRAE